MTFVTIRVLEGMEQGRVYSRLALPVSVGREDENSIQLNDDRISRFHARIQDHSGRVILTDLDSTNGTRVNGHPIQMRILQIGDVITVGRCVLVLSERQENLPEPASTDDPDPFRTVFAKPGQITGDESKHMDFDGPIPGIVAEPESLFPNGGPELPSKLNSLQQVQLSDLLSFVHERLGAVVKQSEEDLESTNDRIIRCHWDTWRQLVDLQSDLAEYIRRINTPES